MSEAQPQQPVFGIDKIYLKDMSLEVPNAPAIFAEREAPAIEVAVHNEAHNAGAPGMFEVVLTLTVTAKIQDKTLFLIEVAQAGLFQIQGVSTADLDAVLGTICPNTLLPYAREAVSTLVARAGFPPVTIQHMNFDAIYMQRLQQMNEQKEGAVAAPQAPAH
jgi:preprotein translocase subunit SecB